MAALKAANLRAEIFAWDDPKARFAEARMTLVRSTWDYFHKPEAFAKWIDAREGRVANAACVLRWNTHKRYLRELDEAGFATVPTVLVPKGTKATLHQVLLKKEWLSAVAKPAVGGGSFLTKRVSNAASDEAWFAEQLTQRDMLVQPFMASVQTRGERSLIFIDGELSHVVVKQPRFADQQESVKIGDDATEEERALAVRAMRYIVTRLPCGSLLYGRVDLMYSNDGAPLISELELTEPSLYFHLHPTGLDRFVVGIQNWLAPIPV